jgi:hypothetical protein
MKIKMMMMMMMNVWHGSTDNARKCSTVNPPNCNDHHYDQGNKYKRSKCTVVLSFYSLPLTNNPHYY